jgi:hypothetical protein
MQIHTGLKDFCAWGYNIRHKYWLALRWCVISMSDTSEMPNPNERIVFSDDRHWLHM